MDIRSIGPATWRFGTVALAAAAVLSSGPAGAGTLDAGTYMLQYDDALGVPTVSAAGGITTYTFPSIFREAEDGLSAGILLSETFSARLVAGAGRAFTTRPDASFPAWADVAVSGFLAYPNKQPPPYAETYPTIVKGSEAAALGTTTVSAPSVVVANRSYDAAELPAVTAHSAENVAVAGARAGAADVSLTYTLYGLGAMSNIWHCDGCQYLGPDEPKPPPILISTTSPEYIRVQASFTPTIHVDDRFVASVPEPGSWAMLLVGLGLLAGSTARRRCG